MSDEPDTDRPSDAEAITSLRGEAPRVVRLSRKALLAAGSVGLALVGGAVLFALQPAAPGRFEEPVNTEGVGMSDSLASAPRDYSQVPRLGPPLPGDLGKPILDAQDRGAVAELPPIGAQPQQVPHPSPREQLRRQMLQEREAARGSRLFFEAATRPGAADRDATAEGPTSAAQGAPTDPVVPAELRIARPSSSGLLQAGSVIPAALITGIRSDQPGLVTAQVTQGVRDSLTGRRLLIPQGSRLIGTYGSDVGFGQRRIGVSWSRLVFPDGRSFDLESQSAATRGGYAGLEDGVDHHWGGVLRAALVSTLLGIGSEVGSGGESDLARALRRGSQDSIGRTGEQIVSRELGIRPTLTIRPGYPLAVLVTRDMDFDQGIAMPIASPSG